MKNILILLMLLIIEINAKNLNDYAYERCMEADIKKRSIITEEEKKEMERKRNKEEILKEDIEWEKITTQKLLDISVIETNTTKTLIIKNKACCRINLKPELAINEELKKLKEFGQEITINEHEEIKIKKLK